MGIIKDFIINKHNELTYIIIDFKDPTIRENYKNEHKHILTTNQRTYVLIPKVNSLSKFLGLPKYPVNTMLW